MDMAEREKLIAEIETRQVEVTDIRTEVLF